MKPTEVSSPISTDHSLLLRVLGPRTFSALRSRVRMARTLVRMARMDWEAVQPIGVKLKAWSNGYRTDSFLIYNVTNETNNDYVNDDVLENRCTKLNASREYFHHKFAFRSVLKHAGVAQPETIALIAHERILLNPLGPDRRYVTAHELEDFLLGDGGSFIVKPEAGYRGVGISLLRGGDAGLVRQRGRLCEAFRMSHVPPVALIERVVPQGPFWMALFPGTGNTIRVLTGWMPGEPQPIILRAVQRIGTADTVPTDNWSGGGVCAIVDLESGRLGPGRVNPLKSKSPVRQYETHPDTGARIEGAILPHWDRIRETVLRASTSSPLNRYVGWDVLVDDEGTPVIVEASGRSDLDLLQIHGGLLADPAAKRFFQASGVI